MPSIRVNLTFGLLCWFGNDDGSVFAVLCRSEDWSNSKTVDFHGVAISVNRKASCHEARVAHSSSGRDHGACEPRGLGTQQHAATECVTRGASFAEARGLRGNVS
jgi:hypothetical protein